MICYELDTACIRLGYDFDSYAASSRTGVGVFTMFLFDMVFGLAAELLSEACFPSQPYCNRIQNRINIVNGEKPSTTRKHKKTIR